MTYIYSFYSILSNAIEMLTTNKGIVMKSFIRNSIYIGIVFTSLGLTACGSESSSSVTTNADNAAKSIVISGSTFARPFFENVLEKYKIRDQSTQYAYHSVGSGAGIEQFITGEADIGTTDAPINTAESSRLKEGYEEIIITSGMISIAYNSDGVKPTKRCIYRYFPWENNPVE